MVFQSVVRSERGFILKVHPEGRSPSSFSQFERPALRSLGAEGGTKGVR